MYHDQTINTSNSSFIRRVWQSIATTFEVVGYARAASHLTTLGYHEEAKHCMLEIRKLKS
jgi:hypothetical protein